MAAPKIILKKSSVTSRVPGTGDLEYGELAINYADGLIYYKTSSNAIHKFLDSDRIAAAYLQTANLLTAINAIDGDGSGLDADLLDGQQGSYYLDYNNFTNTPTNVSTFTNDANYLDSTTVTGVINSAYVNNLVDSVNEATNAFTLNNQPASYYLDYSNFTNTPTNVSAFTNDANYLDSDTVTGVINSSYIQSNQITYTTADFTDSAYVSTQITTAINNLIDGAPIALDTLNELAAALNDDANFAATVTNAIAALPDSAQVVDIIDSHVANSDIGVQLIYGTRGDNLWIGGDNSEGAANISLPASGLGHTLIIQNNEASVEVLVNQATFTFDSSGILVAPYFSGQYLGFDSDVTAAGLATEAFVNSAISTGLATIDSNYVQARQDYQYSSLIGAPENLSDFINDTNYLDSTTVQGVINSTYVNGLVDSVGQATNALTLNNQSASYYLDYNNFTNTPTIPVVGTDALAYDSNLQSFVTAFTLPTSDGSNGQVLTTNGSGTLSFTTVTSGGGIDSAAVLAIVDSAYINGAVDSVGQATNALTLGGNSSSYYLAASTYTANDILTKIKTVDGTGSGLDADLLDGQHGSYYLDYSNFTNTPSNVSAFTNDANYLDSTTVQDVINSAYVNGLVDSVTNASTALYATNADQWDGNQFADYLNQDVKTTASPIFNGLTVSGTLTVNGTINTLTATALNSDSATITTLSGGSLTSSNFASAVSLIIYDSTGSAIKTLYGAAS